MWHAITKINLKGINSFSREKAPKKEEKEG
jgi:hypothetical protein